MHISSYGASVMFRALRWIALVVSTAGLSTVMFSVPVQAREAVTYSGSEAPGQSWFGPRRLLYFVVGEGRAIRYPVGVGRSGKQWFGSDEHREQARSSSLDAAGGHEGRQATLCHPRGALTIPAGAAACWH